MKNRLLVALSVLLVCVISLASCGLFGGDGTGDKQPGADGKVSFKQIVLGDAELDILALRSQIFDIIGAVPSVTDAEAAVECEIVIGDTTRSVTAAAKSELEKLKASGASTYGYIIYFDGKSVSVYWEHEQLSSLALAKFESICVKSKRLELTSGVIDSKIYTQAELEQDAKWQAIETTASSEVYQALRNWYGLFNGPYTVGWLANLYDPEIGGFYYSNSARDNEPFRPDLESTYQALNWLSSHKAINYNDLPNEMKAQIVAFAKSTQSAEDGYFYHKQWGDRSQLQVDRYGRDLTWATWLIKNLKVDTDGDGVGEQQYPNYCAPSLKCEEHAKNGGSCSTVSSVSYRVDASVGVTSPFGSTVSSAVSRAASSVVRPTASTGLNFSSADAFIESLATYNATVKENSGNAHNINALQDDIWAKGYDDELLDFLDNAQAEVYEEQTASGEEPSGCWQYTADYKLVWGLHKYMPFYNASGRGRTVTYHKELVESCMKVILSPADGKYAVNDIMNMWTAINHVITNAKTYAKDKVPELQAMVRDNALDLIAMSSEKILQFRLEEGTFTTDTSLTSRANLYGVSISLGAKEADVNANLLVGNLANAPFNTMGFSPVPLCTSDDGEMFVETISELEPIDKIPQPEAKIEDFDGKNISVLNNSYYATWKQNSSDCVVDIVEDYETDSDVLYFRSGIGSTVNNQADYLYLKAGNSGGNCNVAEFDFRLVSVSKDSHIFQIKVGDGFQFIMYKSGDYLTISAIQSENVSLGSEKLVTTAHKLPAFEWCKIRIEVFDPLEGEYTPTIKFYVNEELVGTTSMYYGSASGKGYSPVFTQLTIYSCAPVATEIYLDNVYLNRENIAQ